jgi:GxxExxY protein
MEYKYSDITEKVIRACMTVHSTLGNGFQEVIYQRALAIEFELIGLSFEREFSMKINYHENHIGDRRVDFLVDGKISVELKALVKLENVHLAQAMKYLEAYNLEVGMLINFGSNSLEWKRLFNKKYNPAIKQ